MEILSKWLVFHILCLVVLGREYFSKIVLRSCGEKRWFPTSFLRPIVVIRFREVNQVYGLRRGVSFE
jgi:hypothetical protein